jgi:XTP/dITP diphosphohydrolase
MVEKVRVVLATTNPGKVAELRALFADSPLDLVTVEGLPPVDEPGPTYADNAARKARLVAERTRAWALADDSGLEVESLGGRPGVHSARYAGEGATDAQNRERLLKELKGRPAAYRKARFVCAMALASPEGVVHVAEGECPGRIAPAPRGENGFGYDPIFWLPDLGKTMAELPAGEKNLISHRAKAAEKMRRIARSLFP